MRKVRQVDIHGKENDPATDKQLSKLFALRRACGNNYKGDIDTLRKGSCGREIRDLTLKLKAKNKPHKYTKVLVENGKVIYRF
jgi:hypothetical protein